MPNRRSLYLVIAAISFALIAEHQAELLAELGDEE